MEVDLLKYLLKMNKNAVGNAMKFAENAVKNAVKMTNFIDENAIGEFIRCFY